MLTTGFQQGLSGAEGPVLGSWRVSAGADQVLESCVLSLTPVAKRASQANQRRTFSKVNH